MDILLVIFQLVVVQAAAGQYYESDSPSAWEDANGRCSMATPDIDVTSDGYSVHTDYNLKHERVWIGYFKMLTVFEYIGCAAVVDSQPHNQTINLTRQYNSPGLCYSKCKDKEIIGVSLDKCVCLGSMKIYDQELQCNMSCTTESESFLCGGQGYMSIYKVNKNETAGTKIQQCLSFERYAVGGQPISWKNCSEYNWIVCENETTEVIVHPEENNLWYKAVNKCFKYGFHPVSYQVLRLQTNMTVGPSWSGIICSDVIYTSKEWRNSYTGVQFGYMSRNKTVDFTYMNYTMYALCNDSATEHTTSTSLHTSRADNTSSIPAVSTYVSSVTDATVAATSSTADIPTTTSRVSSGQDAGDSDTRQNKQSITMSPDVGVIAGASVAAVLLVAALIVVFVFLKRRRKLPDMCSKLAKTTKSENTDQSIPAYAKVVKTSKTPEREDNKASDKIVDSNYAHTYFVLEPQSNDSETYDISGQGKQKTKENDTVYNTLNSETSTTYDHAYNRKKDFVSENDYDTAEKAAMKLKARVEKLPEDYAEADNDTYNHINNKTADGANTDNTYNVPNQYNCSGNAGKTSDKEDHEEVDTYSHINGKPVNSYKPDNVYGTPDNKHVSSI